MEEEKVPNQIHLTRNYSEGVYLDYANNQIEFNIYWNNHNSTSKPGRLSLKDLISGLQIEMVDMMQAYAELLEEAKQLADVDED